MAFPRLPAAANPFDVTVTIGVNLRPYLEAWFNATKADGQSVEDFVKQQLKKSAADWYISQYAKSEYDAVESDRLADLQAITDDADTLKGELD